MNFTDLLIGNRINPNQVLVLRHRPQEDELHEMMPSLAAERPEVFNAYQRAQNERVERQMKEAKYIASFIGHTPKKALFVGIYSNDGHRSVNLEQFWKIRECSELRSLGMHHTRPICLWFDLVLTEHFAEWKGKLIICWPAPEISWFRWAHTPKNVMPIDAILSETALTDKMPSWQAIDWTWEKLAIIPQSWKNTLREWRGVYYIFDTSDNKGYVGAAYGDKNLYGRWTNYAARGDGGNRLLKKRDPKNFRFTILDLASPIEPPAKVIQLEGTWKDRLHTRQPYGLNIN